MNLCLYDNCYDDDDEEEEEEEDSRNPALAGLDGKESEHRGEAVVVVEVLPAHRQLFILMLWCRNVKKFSVFLFLIQFFIV